MPVYESFSESDTIKTARELAAQAQPGDVYFLQGTLGAGKSVFARAFIRFLAGSDIDVPSPTFTIVQTYETQAGPVWHFDLYRLQDPEEIYETGWEEAISDGITLVEWPERLGTLFRSPTKTISIETSPGPLRRIKIA